MLVKFTYISTHTLRGERDFIESIIVCPDKMFDFNSHAPWGA